MLVPNNEGRVCDAVVRTLEKWTRETRTNMQFPDKEGVGPPVDLRLSLGTQDYAIEHTRIESFEKQIAAFAVAKRIIRYIQKNIQNPFPSMAYYELQFPTWVSVPDGRGKGDRALGNLVAWVREKEEILRKRNSGRNLFEHKFYEASDSIRGIPTGFDSEFDLLHWPIASLIRRKPGTLSFRLIPPNDPEGQLSNSLRQTFLKKCPKLNECKVEGARTVLVFESSDPALSSFEFRGNLLPSVLSECANAPDEIFLAETCTDCWCVWLLKRDESHWPDTGMPELNKSYYDPDLSDLPRIQEYLVSVPKNMRDALQLSVMDTPYLPGWAPKHFNKDEMNDLMTT